MDNLWLTLYDLLLTISALVNLFLILVLSGNIQTIVRKNHIITYMASQISQLCIENRKMKDQGLGIVLGSQKKSNVVPLVPKDGGNK